MTQQVFQNNKLNECYFSPRTKSSSETICNNCGKEKMLHTIGYGIKCTKSIIIKNKLPTLHKF